MTHKLETGIALSSEDYAHIEQALANLKISNLHIKFSSIITTDAHDGSEMIVFCVSIPQEELRGGPYNRFDPEVTHRFPETLKIINAGIGDHLWFYEWKLVDEKVELYFFQDFKLGGWTLQILGWFLRL